MKGILVVLFLGISWFFAGDDEHPVISKLTIHPCKKSCEVPQAVSAKSFMEGNLKLIFSINRNCTNKDSAYAQVSGDTLNIFLTEKKENAECECLYKYEMEISGLKREPRLIAVNDNVHVDGFGFLSKSSAADDLNFVDSLDRSGKFPLNQAFVVEDATFDKDKHKILSWPVDFGTYLEIKQYLRVELRGNLSSDENDSTLAYKRAKALREFLVKKRELCTNRVAINLRGGKLATAPREFSRSVTAYLSYGEVYDSLPAYK